MYNVAYQSTTNNLKANLILFDLSFKSSSSTLNTNKMDILYQNTISIEERAYQRKIDLKLRYRNVAISNSTWIGERAHIENGRLQFLHGNMEFLKTLMRKFIVFLNINLEIFVYRQGPL